MWTYIINGRFLLHRVTGVERYAREIILELDNLVEENYIEIAIPPEVTDVPTYKNIKVTKVGSLHNRLWEHISFPRYVKKRHGISINLCNVAPLPSPGIVCIHDVKVKAHPEYFSKKFILWYTLLFCNATRHAIKLITVSEFSKKEIVKYYRVSPDIIEVIPSAWTHYNRIGYDNNALIKYGLKKNSFYFAMGSMELNKNFRWIAEVAKRMPECVFAIAGAINENVFSESMGFAVPNNMLLLGYVSDEEAKVLMRDCKAFLFPSIYEGFGLPPLEAIGAGCKCIVVSDTEVMHEVYGESANYIDIKKYELPENLVTANSDLLHKFTWKNNAKLLFDFIKRLNIEHNR